MHILFADDVKDTRDLFALAFKMSNHSIRLASDGVEAVASVETEEFDVIVLDVQMPRMDGWEALQRIRELPNGSSVPIALFSGSLHYDQIEDARKRGADIVFHKPIFPNAMLLMMEDLVQEHRKRQAP
ncbi:MAG: hypothetical protein JWN98_1412 [Abditibacteriota bacterium]|nr:hypothetical protein [Abditibacteriota bacterium]